MFKPYTMVAIQCSNLTQLLICNVQTLNNCPYSVFKPYRIVDMQCSNLTQLSMYNVRTTESTAEPSLIKCIAQDSNLVCSVKEMSSLRDVCNFPKQIAHYTQANEIIR